MLTQPLRLGGCSHSASGRLSLGWVVRLSRHTSPDALASPASRGLLDGLLDWAWHIYTLSETYVGTRGPSLPSPLPGTPLCVGILVGGNHNHGQPRLVSARPTLCIDQPISPPSPRPIRPFPSLPPSGRNQNPEPGRACRTPTSRKKKPFCFGGEPGLYFLPERSLALCSLSTFFTIFCSSIRKARTMRSRTQFAQREPP
jgi:hypothetical protein